MNENILNMNIEFQDIEMMKQKKYLKIVNDMYAGFRVIGEDPSYLKRFNLEKDDDYNNRRQHAVLFNYFKKTINNLTSILVRKDASLKVNNEAYKYLESNIDNQGSSINSFLKGVAKNALIDGLTWIWADASVKDDETMLGKNRQQLFLKNVKMTDIVSIDTINNKGHIELKQVVIKNIVKNYKNPFEFNYEIRFIVLDKQSNSIYKKDNKGKYVLESSSENELGYIPLFPVYAEKTDVFKSEIPFLDLAFLNLKHYNALSNYDNIQSLACVPVPLLYIDNEAKSSDELVKNGLSIGASTALIFEDKTKFGFEWAQVDSSCLQELRANVKEIEDKMEAISFSVLSKQAFNTATEAEIADTQSGLFLIELANSLEDAFEKSFQAFSDYMNVEIDYKLNINKDFNSRLLSKDYVLYLIDLRSKGYISTDTLWDTLIRGEILKIDDYDIEKEKIAQENGSL